MPRIIFPFLLLLLLPAPLLAQRTLWTYGTARTVPENQQEFGLIHPLQMGVSPTMEISVQPLMALALAPNLTLKKRWTSDRWLLASQHTYVMPTMALRTMQDLGFQTRKDTLGERHPLIPDTLTIPYIFMLRNEVLLSRRIGSETMLTAKAGFAFSIRTRTDSLPPLNHPLLYMYGSTLDPRILSYAGIRIDGNIVRNYNYMADVTFLASGLLRTWALEHRAYFIWNKSIRFAALAGYKMSYGNYPFDPKFAIFPMVDLIWKINIQPQKPERDLFRQ